MVVASIVFGVALALASLYAPGALVGVAIVGGAAVGIGWAFYAERE